MAREMYLVGVPKEELQPSAPIQPPQTPKGKWENFWYHNKWPFLIGVFLAVVAVVCLVQFLTRTKYDYLVVMVTEYSMTDPEREAVVQLLEKAGKDVNGDGEIHVNFDNLVISPDLRLQQQTRLGQTKMSGYLAAGEVMVYGFSPYYYDMLHKSLRPENMPEDESFYFFADLGELSNNDGNPTVWNWSQIELHNAKGMENLPDDIWFGVRKPTGTAKESLEEYKHGLQLLTDFIRQNEGEEQDEK